MARIYEKVKKRKEKRKEENSKKEKEKKKGKKEISKKEKYIMGVRESKKPDERGKKQERSSWVLRAIALPMCACSTGLLDFPPSAQSKTGMHGGAK